MSFQDRDFDRGRGREMDWNGEGNGYRGQSNRQEQFDSQSGYGRGDDGSGHFGNQGFRGQERFGSGYGQGGYGQEYGRPPADWQESSQQDRGGSREYGGGSMSQYGDRGYDQRGRQGAGGILPNAQQGWGSQGRRRAGSWDQRQNWEQGPSGRGNWGQGYSDQDFGGQDQSSQRYFGQGRSDEGGGAFSYEEVWLIPGPHSGRGPRGYQRNDQRIEEDICERLTHHGQVNAEDIQVQVQNGEVTLTGTVENRRAKRMAEDVLDSISGIKDVHNQLRVQQGQGQGQRQTDQDQLVGQTRMSEGDGQSSSGSGRGQNRNQSRRNETAQAGASSS